MLPEAKIMKIFTYMNSNIFNQMRQVPFFYSLTLIFISVQKFLVFFMICEYRKQWEIEQALLLLSDKKSYITIAIR